MTASRTPKCINCQPSALCSNKNAHWSPCSNSKHWNKWRSTRLWRKQVRKCLTFHFWSSTWSCSSIKASGTWWSHSKTRAFKFLISRLDTQSSNSTSMRSQANLNRHNPLWSQVSIELSRSYRTVRSNRMIMRRNGGTDRRNQLLQMRRTVKVAKVTLAWLGVDVTSLRANLRVNSKILLSRPLRRWINKAHSRKMILAVTLCKWEASAPWLRLLSRLLHTEPSKWRCAMQL